MARTQGRVVSVVRSSSLTFRLSSSIRGVSEPPRGFEGESVLTIGDIPRQQGDDDAQDRGDFNNVFETSDLVIATLRHADLAM